MNSEVVCEITFKDSQLDKMFTIVGKVREKQIFSSVGSWILVSNIVLRDGKWESFEHTIHKATIQKLSIKMTRKSYTFEKESLELHQIILNNSLPVSIS